MFAKLLLKRIRAIVDGQRSKDQTGFRPRAGIEDAFTIFECICGKNVEWNAPVWFASMDLPKTFNRVEYDPSFGALLDQGVPTSY